MEVYQNIWRNGDKTHLDKHSQLISQSVINLGLFQHEDEKQMKQLVGEINALLNAPKTRNRGLRLLSDVAPQCSRLVLSEQCERWFKFCCDAVAAGRKTHNMTPACQILTTLLQDLPSLPELQRCISSKVSATLASNLASVDMASCPAALQCLYECFRAAPAQCLQHKKLLEERILHHLDDPIPLSGPGGDVTRLAGRAFAALPLPGLGGGNVAQARAEARGRQLTQLLALAHSLMDSLFDGVVERESHPHPKEHTALPLRPLEDLAAATTTSVAASRLLIVTRLANTLKFVSEMITDEANPTITITADHLLSVPFRMLQVETEVLSTYKSQEHKILAFFLPSLHHHAFLLLRDVITSLDEAMDCYFSTLGELVVSVLKDDQGQSCGQPVWCSRGQETRVLAYGVMAELVRASAGRHTPPPGLVAMLLQDAVPKVDQVKLQKHKGGLASLSVQKGAGKKGYTVTSTGPAGGHAGPLPRPHRFSRLARVALVVAEMLFTHASHSMALKDHKKLQEGVLEITKGVVGVGRAHPSPLYSNAATRLQLFLALSSLASTPLPHCPPPYTLITHLLQAGLSDADAQVVSTCQAALCVVSLIVANPRVEAPSRPHTHTTNGTDETEEEEEVEGRGSTTQQEEINGEEEEEEEEEPMIETEKINEVEEEEEEKEEQNGIEEATVEKEEEEEEEEEKNETVEEEDKEKEVTGDDEEEEEKSKHEEKKKEENRSRRKESPPETKTARRKKEEEGRRGRGKRNRGRSDPPAKRVKANDDKEGGAEFLSVEDMLKDFVEC